MQVKCRICGDNHLSIKCPKVIQEKQVIPEKQSTLVKCRVGEGNHLSSEWPKVIPEKQSMLVKCRVCGGNHLSSKCPQIVKEKPETVQNNKKYNVQYDKQKISNSERNIFKVKIENLPYDISNEELMEQLYNWGDITDIKIMNYAVNSTAFISFSNKEHAEYFIKALDNTKFEFMIIKLHLIYS